MNPIETTEAQEQAEYCGILGNALRIQIIWTLGDRELTVTEIAEDISASDVPPLFVPLFMLVQTAEIG